MKEHEVNKLDNFIMGWYADDHGLSDTILEYFKKNRDRHYVGTIGNGQYVPSTKDSMDFAIIDPDMYILYEDHVSQCVYRYLEKYKYAHGQIAFDIRENINIQHYKPDGGYPEWHCERAMVVAPNVARHLFFITYLDDVTDKGETEFFYQKVKIKAEKGLTIIAPCDWTFTHRGVPSPTQHKHIVTGWFHIIPTQDQQLKAMKDLEQLVEKKARELSNGKDNLIPS